MKEIIRIIRSSSPAWSQKAQRLNSTLSLFAGLLSRNISYYIGEILLYNYYITVKEYKLLYGGNPII